MSSNFIGRADLPRGLRNNNPGNIRSGDTWQGMIGVDPSDFIIFQDISWGIRALATDLLNKIKKGLNTITAIVNDYAPASDKNDVPAYIAAVAADSGLGPNDVIPTDFATLHALIRAFMNHELGDTYSAMVTDEDIDQGIGMINDSLLTFIQAAGLAVENVVSGGGNTSGVLLGVGLAGVALYLLTRKK